MLVSDQKKKQKNMTTYKQHMKSQASRQDGSGYISAYLSMQA